MAEALTADYINNHLQGVHTPESWGRAVVEQALRAAAAEVNKEGATISATGEVDTGGRIMVAAYTPAGCITVTAVVNGVTVSYHQNI